MPAHNPLILNKCRKCGKIFDTKSNIWVYLCSNCDKSTIRHVSPNRPERVRPKTLFQKVRAKGFLLQKSDFHQTYDIVRISDKEVIRAGLNINQVKNWLVK